MRHVPRVELTVLALCLACQGKPSAEADRRGRASAAASAFQLVTRARQTAPFRCGAEACVQSHPSLPDSGEWRCAESEQVVWCAGGEPAAGVVPAPPDPRYRCGQRFGTGPSERVCIDEAPDYPPPHAQRNRCSFSQERGVERWCKPGAAQARRPLAEGALPACWLGRDCRSGSCDRGACRCNGDADCDRGACSLGVCVEAKQ